MSGCIHRVGATFCVAAADGMWLPGIYADEAACRKALDLAETDYRALAVAVDPDMRGNGDNYRPVTAADLDGLYDILAKEAQS